MTITRFAPSPTGYLHLGHAFSAFIAAQKGEMLLRIEDIDQGRARPEFIAAIYEDLAWLGLSWPQPVRLQSEHLAEYQRSLKKLEEMGVTYPCFCTRKEINALAGAPHEGEAPLYPGICKNLSFKERERKQAEGKNFALRLDAAKARQITGPLFWDEEGQGKIAVDPYNQGDVVLARKDFPASYHLAVVHDDALQGVEFVTRGQDLFTATHVQRILQALLGLPAPLYYHHPLITDAKGERLAKRKNSPALRDLRAQGWEADAIKRDFIKKMA